MTGHLPVRPPPARGRPLEGRLEPLDSAGLGLPGAAGVPEAGEGVAALPEPAPGLVPCPRVAGVVVQGEPPAGEYSGPRKLDHWTRARWRNASRPGKRCHSGGEPRPGRAARPGG